MTATPGDVAEFQRGLRVSGCYRTDPERPKPFLDRLLGRFDAWYYVRLVGVLHDAERAARGTRHAHV